VEGTFDYPAFSFWYCYVEGWLGKSEGGDLLPSLMHSITSTQNYIIIPLTSVSLNPCELLKKREEITLKSLYRFDKNAPVTFLIFDKRTKKFLPPIKYDEQAHFISHQFNAYELSEDVIVADMITYDDFVYEAVYVDMLTRGTLKNPSRAKRFTLNLKEETASAESLLPENSDTVEFPQVNHNFDGKPYKFGYVVTDIYMAGNALMKIDVTDASGNKNKIWRPQNGESISLLEPYFAQKPGSKEEDDGVLVLRGFDSSIDKTRVYVVDAKTMEQVGEILAPTDIPFGFHERFYLRSSFDFKKEQKNVHSEL